MESVTLRNGDILRIGDEVETDFYKKCVGMTFIIESIEPCIACESGALVVAHVKGEPEKKILGFKKEGKEFQDGVDANIYKKLK